MVAGLAAFAATGSPARAATAPVPPPPIQARVQLDLQRVTVGSVLPVTFSVEMPREDHLQWPAAAGATWGPFEVRGVEPPERHNIEAGQARETVRVRVATFDLGSVVLPGPVLRVHGHDSLSFHLPSAGVLVQSVMGPRDKSRDIRDIKGPTGWRRPLPRWARGALVALGAILVAGLIAWLVWYLRRRRREAELRLPAHVRALRDLEALRRSDLLQSGRIKDYHVRLTEILRRYLGERGGFAALDLTTEEVLEQVRSALPEAHPRVKKILEISDLVKFARQVPGPGASEGLLESARQVVESTRPQTEPPAVGREESAA